MCSKLQSYETGSNQSVSVNVLSVRGALLLVTNSAVCSGNNVLRMNDTFHCHCRRLAIRMPVVGNPCRAEFGLFFEAALFIEASVLGRQRALLIRIATFP